MTFLFQILFPCLLLSLFTILLWHYETTEIYQEHNLKTISSKQLSQNSVPYPFQYPPTRTQAVSWLNVVVLFLFKTVIDKSQRGLCKVCKQQPAKHQTSQSAKQKVMPNRYRLRLTIVTGSAPNTHMPFYFFIVYKNTGENKEVHIHEYIL